MRYLTYKDLYNQSISIESKNLCNDKPVVVFLSHKHEEVNFVLKIKEFFDVQGIYVKVDWLDPYMPKVTSLETAYKIRQHIMHSDKFILIDSESSKESLWIPWELGFADGVKGLIDIAVLPVTYNTQEWKGREYYGIYNFLRYDENDTLSLCNPSGRRIMSLVQWLET